MKKVCEVGRYWKGINLSKKIRHKHKTPLKFLLSFTLKAVFDRPNASPQRCP
jgi:hypothetical protein